MFGQSFRQQDSTVQVQPIAGDIQFPQSFVAQKGVGQCSSTFRTKTIPRQVHGL